MSVLSWIVVGLIAGWLAGVVMKGRGFGLLGDIIIGIVGALLGGFIATSVFKVPNPVNGINLLSILVAFLGSILVTAILRAVSSRRRIIG